jgi:hypothetical protein
MSIINLMSFVKLILDQFKNMLPRILYYAMATVAFAVVLAAFIAPPDDHSGSYNVPTTAVNTQTQAVAPPSALSTTSGAFVERTKYTVTLTTTMSAQTRTATIPGPTTTQLLKETVTETETKIVTSTVSANTALSAQTTITSTQTVTTTVERAAETCTPHVDHTLRYITRKYHFVFELCGAAAMCLFAVSFRLVNPEDARRGGNSDPASSDDRRAADTANVSPRAGAEEANAAPRAVVGEKRGRRAADDANAGRRAGTQNAKTGSRARASHNANSRGRYSGGRGEARRDGDDTEASEASSTEDSGTADIITESELDTDEFSKGVRADDQDMGERVDKSNDQREMPGNAAGSEMGEAVNEATEMPAAQQEAAGENEEGRGVKEAPEAPGEAASDFEYDVTDGGLAAEGQTAATDGTAATKEPELAAGAAEQQADEVLIEEKAQSEPKGKGRKMASMSTVSSDEELLAEASPTGSTPAATGDPEKTAGPEQQEDEDIVEEEFHSQPKGKEKGRKGMSAPNVADDNLTAEASTARSTSAATGVPETGPEEQQEDETVEDMAQSQAKGRGRAKQPTLDSTIPLRRTSRVRREAS